MKTRSLRIFHLPPPSPTNYCTFPEMGFDECGGFRVKDAKNVCYASRGQLVFNHFGRKMRWLCRRPQFHNLLVFYLFCCCCCLCFSCVAHPSAIRSRVPFAPRVVVVSIQEPGVSNSFTSKLQPRKRKKKMNKKIDRSKTMTFALVVI